MYRIAVKASYVLRFKMLGNQDEYDHKLSPVASRNVDVKIDIWQR